ncbi:esterase [Candidatus Vecturithrix granuli]|uniref:Esterase n=1 Tax=Vecturithrix granuli TaxID=1499967 RepID=A0A081BUB6_VECG1|nr:esterase [Candidatus Vecturithrix granuli]
MNTRIWKCITLITILAVMTLTAVPAAPQSATPTPRPTVEMKLETITSQALTGNLFGDPAERTVYILLPPGYAASDRRYPVVYVMPWGRGEPSENAQGFKWTMETLLRDGEIEEMIIVVPDGTNKFGMGLLMSSSTLGDYETYATQEVVAYVDTHYRTLATRDSRGLAGCSNGGTTSMRLGFKYPTVFSVVAATGGAWDYSPELWPSDVEPLHQLKELPRNLSDLHIGETGMIRWYLLMAAAAAPNPDNPPFYCEMPFRTVDGRAEFVPEVLARIFEFEIDAAHEARRYVQQPVRLRGILLRYGAYDHEIPILSVHSFVQVLTELGIEHEYVEEKSGHCDSGWEEPLLKYMSDKLVFEGK